MARSAQLDLGRLPFRQLPRTLYVTGKGGVGKTTVAAITALGLAAAGQRTLLVELEGHEGAAALLGDREVGYDPVTIGRNLQAMCINPRDALREYARMQLKVKAIADRLVGNPVVSQFAQVAPGMDDVVTLGKVWKLATMGYEGEHWDAIVVDAPATGHGIGLLTMVATLARAIPMGLISTHAREVNAFVQRAEEFGVLLVTLPEELPVSEALELHDILLDEEIDVGAVIANGVLPARFTAAEAKVLDRNSRSSDEDMRGVFDTALGELQRVGDQADELERLESVVGPIHELPFIFTGSLDRSDLRKLEQAAVGQEARALGAAARSAAPTRAGARKRRGRS